MIAGSYTYYGVPQMGERLFLIGYRWEIANGVTFPEPTHWVDLPPGYGGSRAVVLKLLRGTDAPEEAFGDLPPIDARAQLCSGVLKRGARRFDKPVPWDLRRKVLGCERIMRTCPGFEAPGEILDHVIRYLPRDYELFARMNRGDQYPQAWRHAHDMLEERLMALREVGQEIRRESREYDAVRRDCVPPYDVRKFPNKWRKMWPDAPARTLMAHLDKDSYSQIHYNNRQARTISVREAARLQSFPDGFVFCGTMNPAFRQIGNAVPPVMAKALAGG